VRSIVAMIHSPEKQKISYSKCAETLLETFPTFLIYEPPLKISSAFFAIFSGQNRSPST
jgi:hypothetical protein